MTRGLRDVPKIQLRQGVGTGLIIACRSGVIYSTQTAGTACFHPELEGVFVPLGNDLDVESEKLLGPQASLEDYFGGPRHLGSGAYKGLDEEDAEFIDGVLRAWSLDGFIEVDRQRLKDSHEAWVLVRIKTDESAGHKHAKLISVAQGFEPYPRTGVLTWTNGD